MTHYEANEIIRNFKYKPNFVVSFDFNLGMTQYILTFKMPAICIESKSPTEICHADILSSEKLDKMSQRDFVEFLWGSIMTMEQHEAAEWFEIDNNWPKYHLTGH